MPLERTSTILKDGEKTDTVWLPLIFLTMKQ